MKRSLVWPVSTYEWNDLDAAQQYGQQCAQLTRQMESVSTSASYGVFLARLKLAQGDVPEAVAVLDEAEEFVRRHNLLFMMPEIAAAQVLTLLHQGNLAAAAHLAEKHELPISQARVHLAQGDPATALAVLEPLRQQVEAKGWEDERLKIMILQAVALHALGENDQGCATCWVRRWHWRSRAALSASLWMKVIPMAAICSTKHLLEELHPIMSASYWQHSQSMKQKISRLICKHNAKIQIVRAI